MRNVFSSTARVDNGAAPATTLASNLTYHGGKVQATGSTSYAIYWEPPTLQNGSPTSVPSSYINLLNRYFGDVGGSGLYNNNTQYYEVAGKKHSLVQNSIQNVSNLGGSYVDTSAYPASDCSDPETPGNCLSDAAIQAEVIKAMTAKGWTGGTGKVFYVFLSNGEGTCAFGNCAFSWFCAYHSSFTVGGTTVIYSNMPYGATPVSGYPGGVCTKLTQYPNGRAADIEISNTSHEQMESVTDFHLDAWYDSGGSEMADKCAYKYGALSLDGGKANQQWNNHYYVVQQEWSNAGSRCVQTYP